MFIIIQSQASIIFDKASFLVGRSCKNEHSSLTGRFAQNNDQHHPGVKRVNRGPRESRRPVGVWTPKQSPYSGLKAHG